MELGSLEYPADLITDPLKRCPVYNNESPISKLSVLLMTKFQGEQLMDDIEVIALGQDTSLTHAQRNALAHTVWNQRGEIYAKYHHLFVRNSIQHFWADAQAKAMVKGGKLDLFLQAKTATTIVNAKGQPRRKAPKQLVDKHDTLGKFLMAKNTIEGRKTAQSARNELHNQSILKIQESGEKTQVRLKQERKATMELTEKNVGMMVQFDRAGQRIAKESNSLLALLNKTVQEKEEAASSFIPA